MSITFGPDFILYNDAFYKNDFYYYQRLKSEVNGNIITETESVAPTIIFHFHLDYLKWGLYTTDSNSSQ